MKKLLMKFVILGSALACLRSVAKADTWHGLILTAKHGALSTQLAPFESQDQCEAAALKLRGDKHLWAHIEGLSVSCFKGK